MKKITSIIFSIIFLITLISPSYIVFAQDGTAANKSVPDGSSVNAPDPKKTTTQPIGKLQNPLRANNVREVIFLAVDIMMFLGVCFAILAIIWVGFKFIMAQGDPKAISEAKSWFFGIIIGLAILISARVIVEIIQNTLIKAEVVDPKAFNP
jgi:hypothetical protein